MKIVFFGTGDIGLPTLEWLIGSPEIELVGTVCQPDKPVGRKQLLTAPATKILATSSDVPVYQPMRLRKEATFLQTLAPDVIVVMAYGQLLPRLVLDTPGIACLNLHASILPRHRGASPIQAAIRCGDEESGITVMYMDEGLDTGDVLLTHRLTLTTDETGQSLHDRLAEAAPAALAESLKQLKARTAARDPQTETLSTHCGRLGREDGRIPWASSAEQIERLVRAYDPWPGTSTRWTADAPVKSATGIRQLKIFPPTRVIVSDSPRCPKLPGTIIAASAEDGILVQTGTNLLEISELQLEGKRRMSAEIFLQGNTMRIGDRFAADP